MCSEVDINVLTTVRCLASVGKARPECLVSFLPLVLDKLLLLMVNIINILQMWKLLTDSADPR